VADGTAAETAWYESPNPAVFEITRSGGDNSQAETVYYTVSGTATNGDDYTYLSGVVTIPVGETSAKVAVQPQDDSIYEGTEGITFSVSSDPSYKLGATTNGTASIEDNDFPPSVITVTTEESVANESGNPAQFRISRSGGDNNKEETVYYSVTGTAENGEDYTYLSGVATIPTGATSTVVTLNPIDDSTYEGTETVTFQVTNNGNYKLGTTTRGEAVIEDNDPTPPEISIGGKSHAFGVSWTGELTRIDLETGVSESLGSTGFSNLNSLTSDSQGKLLTIANVNSSVGEIIQIDPKDGTSQVVSTFNNNFGGVRASVRGLTHASDGNLYAIHNMSGSDFIGGDALFRIDPQTGTSSKIATLDRSSLQSLAMAPSGKLYSIDMSDGALIEIDPNTGSSKTVGAKGGFLNIQGLAFDDNGILYATGQPNSYTVDLQTGALTPVPELGTFRGLAFVSESQPAGSPGTSNATTLYDITFDESSQALGQQPLANDSSNTVSRVVFGDPTVEQSSSRLGNRPLVFTDDQSGYDQVKLNVGAGFDRYSLSFDFDPVRLNGEEMTVLLDTPGVRNIYFQPDGSVRLLPFGRVGTFDLNGVNQVETEMDFESDRWKLIINGNVLYDGEFLPSSNDLQAIRFSLGALSGASGSVAAIDNIQVKGLSSSSATTPPPVAGSPDPGVAPPAATTP
jgi:sugar lactone lactonase YvrE